MKVLVTGATGRLGSVVCKDLLQRGHDVLATDQRASAELGVPLKPCDLREAQPIYALLEGREAVVHLANIPSLHAGHAPQVVLSDNVAMNANVFRAAVDLGVRRLVFASSLQAMIRLDNGRPAQAPYTIPYFPLDGDAPANPGHNFYGLSKEIGERLLRISSEQHPELACTSLRFPMLAGDWFQKRLAEPVPPSALNFGEALAYLDFSDAARLVGLVLERQEPGYHQYFPAQALQLAGYTAESLAAEFFPQIRRKNPGTVLSGLVDHRALEQDFGFSAAPPLLVRLEQR